MNTAKAASPSADTRTKTVAVTFHLSLDHCFEILRTAIEAGVQGAIWLRDYDATLDVKKKLLRIGDPNDGAESDEPALRHLIGAADMGAAIGMMLSEGGSNARLATQAMGDDLDGPSADVVLQYVVFGKQVYA